MDRLRRKSAAARGKLSISRVTHKKEEEHLGQPRTTTRSTASTRAAASGASKSSKNLGSGASKKDKTKKKKKAKKGAKKPGRAGLRFTDEKDSIMASLKRDGTFNRRKSHVPPDALMGALNSMGGDFSPSRVRQALILFYDRHNPEKDDLGEVLDILIYYASQQGLRALNTKLRLKYGEDLDDIQVLDIDDLDWEEFDDSVPPPDPDDPEGVGAPPPMPPPSADDVDVSDLDDGGWQLPPPPADMAEDGPPPAFDIDESEIDDSDYYDGTMAPPPPPPSDEASRSKRRSLFSGFSRSRKGLA